jgi:putative hydrolases of HD superfamily
MKEKDFIEFAKMVGKMKRIPRTGWKIRGVKEAESIADHSFGATLLGMVLSDLEGMDTEKIMRMLILHDIEEIETGDVDAITKRELNKEVLKDKQLEAVRKAISPLPETLKKRYLSLWEEVEEGKTLEAKFCKDIDKLEMMLQLVSYENEDMSYIEKLKVFWEREDINIPKRIDSIVKIYEELRKERDLK